MSISPSRTLLIAAISCCGVTCGGGGGGSSGAIPTLIPEKLAITSISLRNGSGEETTQFKGEVHYSLTTNLTQNGITHSRTIKSGTGTPIEELSDISGLSGTLSLDPGIYAAGFTAHTALEESDRVETGPITVNSSDARSLVGEYDRSQLNGSGILITPDESDLLEKYSQLLTDDSYDEVFGAQGIRSVTSGLGGDVLKIILSQSQPIIEYFVNGYDPESFVGSTDTDGDGSIDRSVQFEVSQETIEDLRALKNPVTTVDGILDVVESTAPEDAEVSHNQSINPYELDGRAPTPENLRIAFVADMGLRDTTRENLRLINKYADVVVINGDMSYGEDHNLFLQMLDEIIDPDKPIIPVIGNHDVSKWSGPGGYQEYFINRLEENENVSSTGDLGVMSALIHKDVFFGLYGFGTKGSQQAQMEHMQDQLDRNPSPLKFVLWHKNDPDYQLGNQGGVGKEPYELARKKGAVIITAHFHGYAVTHTMDNFETRSIAPTNSPDTLILREETDDQNGMSFAVISGVGGRGFRAVEDDREKAPHWRIALGYQSDNAPKFGALYVTVNVDGRPNSAKAKFRAIDDTVMDEFDIVSEVNDPDFGVNPSLTTEVTISYRVGEKNRHVGVLIDPIEDDLAIAARLNRQYEPFGFEFIALHTNLEMTTLEIVSKIDEAHAIAVGTAQ